jgi:hypothetical protein
MIKPIAEAYRRRQLFSQGACETAADEDGSRGHDQMTDRCRPSNDGEAELAFSVVCGRSTDDGGRARRDPIEMIRRRFASPSSFVIWFAVLAADCPVQDKDRNSKCD